jgi:hypothetical protein
LGFEGFDLPRIDAAIAMHRQGIFYESSTLMVSVLRTAAVYAALHQAVAPILALRRHVHGGDVGIAKLVAGELAEQLCPRGGLLESPHFPSTLWGTTAIGLRMLGFTVWQHVDGDMDPVTGVRPRFSRIFPWWSITKTRSPNVWLAQTTEGPIQIKNDGKFTIVQSTDEGHLYDAAITALADPSLSARITEKARDNFLDVFGNPKLLTTLPQHIAPRGDQTGEDYFQACAEMLYGPDGRAVFPYGADAKFLPLSGEGSKAYGDAYTDRLIAIFMVLTGSAGTIGSGSATGAGPYQAQKGGAWSVRNDLVAEPVMAMVRAANSGHCRPYAEQNYAGAIAEARAAGEWVEPVLEVPLVSPERDDRIDSLTKRLKARTDEIAARRAAGIEVTQTDADALADDLEVRRVRLATAPASSEGGADGRAADDAHHAAQISAAVSAAAQVKAERDAGLLVDGDRVAVI